MDALIQGSAADGKTSLSRARIVDAALAVVDREGLGALTMRRLASELEAAPMALYHHFPNKAALCNSLVETVLGAIDVTPPAQAQPIGALKSFARAYRHVLAAHPNLLPIVIERAPRTPASLQPVEAMLRILVDGGLTPAQALIAMNTMAAFVRGSIRPQVGGPMVDGPADSAQDAPELPDSVPSGASLLSEAIRTRDLDAAGEFEVAIDAIARGLAALGGRAAGGMNP